MSETPEYYQLQTGDLYDLFIDQRGIDAVREHLEMAAIEYLWRCRHKGQYLRDLEKVRVIIDRLIDLADHDEPPVPAATLDDALHVLAQHGYGTIPPPAPQAVNGTHVPINETVFWGGKGSADSAPVPPPTPPTQTPTVLAHCVRVDEQRQGIAVPVELKQQLAAWGIPANSAYDEWAAALARASEGRYPEEVPHGR